MSSIFIVSDHILSPIGSGTAVNMEHLKKGQSGIKLQEAGPSSPAPFYASLFNGNELPTGIVDPSAYTPFEQLLITSIEGALKTGDVDIRDKKTALIISSTKGNISLLETGEYSGALIDRIALPASAKRIAAYFQHPNQPIIVSNACISGSLAMLTGLRLIRSGQFEHAVVAGCDTITKFVLSGFQSFQAISESPCKPFDADRNGITLGEAAATVILSSASKYAGNIQLKSGSVTNDANHISGPSRTGEELYQAISSALRNAGLTAADIGFISAHGTATIYNDEMEAKAISLADMEHIPVNSLKGYYGHTLGASGLVESIVSIHSLHENMLLPTKGFNKTGVSKPIHICSTLQPLIANNFLKTASGFGGCNAALVFGS